MIPFNKPHYTGKELDYISQVLSSGKISGNGTFTERCQDYFEKKYNFSKVLLTTSCTSALEMAALLLDIKEGDEVIAPSYTFVSTVNPFVLRGAKIIFVDSNSNNPNMDVDKIEALITSKTRVIIPVHYAGFACDMDKIMALAQKHNLFVVEDAAHAIDSFYKNKPLGSIGHLAAFSFHETKNIISGEGGMLVINDTQFVSRAEIIREMGTNRSAFKRGEVDNYGWVDVGSSYLLSEVSAAFLYSQIEKLDDIQNTRIKVWNMYYNGLKKLNASGKLKLPVVSDFAHNNAHIFFINCKDFQERNALMKHLKKNNIGSAFHYLSLHKSPYYLDKHDGRVLENSDNYTETLLRFPLYYGLKEEEIMQVVNSVLSFYN